MSGSYNAGQDPNYNRAIGNTGNLDEIKKSDDFQLRDSHSNARGLQTAVFENQQTGEVKTFPNVSKDKINDLQQGGGNQ